MFEVNIETQLTANPNTPPRFIIEPEAVVLTTIVDNKWDLTIQFSEIYDEESDDVTASADLSTLKDFLRFDKSLRQI